MEKDIMRADLTFFTNEKDSTLLDWFKATLENNTQFFDVLVGYFRTSGFFHLINLWKRSRKSVSLLVSMCIIRHIKKLYCLSILLKNKDEPEEK